MPFSKTFPKTVPGTNYPIWEEIFLTEEEEQQVEAECKKINFQLMDECIQNSKMLAIKNGMNEDTNVTRIAVSLFEKRASHVVFWKESKAKEKFETQKGAPETKSQSEKNK